MKAIIFFIFCLPFYSYAQKADECRIINHDRERLECFDEIYLTPVSIKTDDKEKAVMQPKEWLLAWEKDNSRSLENPDFFETVEQGNFQNNIFLTKPIDDIGLLVFSCVDKISRVELMLNRPVVDGVVPVEIMGANVQRRNWLSDDTGYILRIGRGIPSIEIMKNMIMSHSIHININGMTTVVMINNLAQQVLPLRQACHW